MARISDVILPMRCPKCFDQMPQLVSRLQPESLAVCPHCGFSVRIDHDEIRKIREVLQREDPDLP